MTAAIVADRAGEHWPEISDVRSLATAAGRADDLVTAELLRMLTWVAHRAATHDNADDATRIDRIALTEKLKAALDAVQAVEMVAFARSQVAEQRRQDLDPAKVGRGIADQIALACKVSSTEGARRLRTARDLCLDLPGVFGLLTHGQISGWTARLIAGELAHLDRPTPNSPMAGPRGVRWPTHHHAPQPPEPADSRMPPTRPRRSTDAARRATTDG
jgi:hypothetical protein